MVGVPCSFALFGGFAIAALVLLLWQHSAEREMSTSAYTRFVPGSFLSDVTSSAQYDRRWFYNTPCPEKDVTIFLPL